MLFVVCGGMAAVAMMFSMSFISIEMRNSQCKHFIKHCLELPIQSNAAKMKRTACERKKCGRMKNNFFFSEAFTGKSTSFRLFFSSA